MKKLIILIIAMSSYGTINYAQNNGDGHGGGTERDVDEELPQMKKSVEKIIKNNSIKNKGTKFTEANKANTLRINYHNLPIVCM